PPALDHPSAASRLIVPASKIASRARNRSCSRCPATSKTYPVTYVPPPHCYRPHDRSLKSRHSPASPPDAGPSDDPQLAVAGPEQLVVLVRGEPGEAGDLVGAEAPGAQGEADVLRELRGLGGSSSLTGSWSRQSRTPSALYSRLRSAGVSSRAS